MTSEIPAPDRISDAGDVELEPSFIPEQNTNFRLARLLLLLDTARDQGRQISSIDRLAYYEFFADNPFIVIEGDKSRDRTDRATIELAGFSSIQLGYASSGHRFLSRRRRLRHDLAHLVALGLASLGSTGYLISARGAELAGQFRSIYADAYRQSAEIILRRLVPLSGARLEAKAEQWLGHSWLLVDLLDDIKDAEVPSDPGYP
ncbi:hypothetical protein RE943_07490 [Prescottella equi]|uniref:hypothetical protein n=1 Tax=Rhodococcus hoagii TaxID=43767 RepID=UPI001C76186D|nr:hypothetical protein [Prescottella equi]BCN67276.1 hypothetical protein RE943_07490 [Prescottella equi]